MKLRSALALSALVSIPALAGCSALTNSDAEPAESDQVTAAFYPLAYATEQVAGDRFTVLNLTQPGKEAHDLELSVKATADIAESALVVYLDGFQPAVDKAIEQNAKGATLDAAQAVTLEPYDDHGHDEHAGETAEEHAAHADEDEHEHETAEEHAAHADEGGHDGHDHGEFDSHFWQDPLKMADFADAVADELAALDEEHADEFAANAAAFRTELEQLDADYAQTLASCRRDLVVVNHDAFGYLSRYGLEFETITGLSPGVEPTIADRTRLHDLIADEGITTVFSESLSSNKAALSVAEDAGVATEVLDPIEGLSDLTRDEDYLSLMRANLTKLSKANGC
ncbi:metal ABC transporter substrate-binding protein [Nocardioides dubius]|uniref:Zinc ABC transporter substrate-binding protein n=1 Tax=Nocardioides dubius TaxID=317019 RepID=A0ABN1TWB6_9ACTN